MNQQCRRCFSTMFNTRPDGNSCQFCIDRDAVREAEKQAQIRGILDRSEYAGSAQRDAFRDEVKRKSK